MPNRRGTPKPNHKIAIVFTLLLSVLLSPRAPGQNHSAASQQRPGPTQTVAQTKIKNQNKPAAPRPDLTQPPIIPGMPFVHIVPYGKPKKMLNPPLSSAGGLFSYWGGPVISNVHIVEVLWGSFVDGPTTSGLQQFLTDIPTTNYFDLLSEYGTVGVPGQAGGAGSNQLIGRGVFDGKFTITPSVCPGGPSNPSCSITDNQIKAELLRQLPHLPAPVTDSQGNYDTFYLLYFPPGVHITLGSLPSCQNNGFCAYHSSLAGSLPSEIPYGVFPDFGPTSGCSQGCGGSTSADNLTSVTSHELGEAVTDENIGNATNFAPPLGWYDTNNDEIGDVCNQIQQPITVGAHTYTVQALFSNMQNTCVIAPAQLNLTAPPSGAIPGRAFNLTVTAASNVYGTLPLYSNTIHFTSSDPQAVLPADYTFVPGADNGTHTFSVTLNTLGSQTVTATDTLAAPITGVATLIVSHQPDLAITKSHTGSFTQGQTGHYTITVANAGDIPTTGAVTVVDSLPPDLSATALSGTGWTCTLATVSCTRADVLPANASYPPIALATKVSYTSGPNIVNYATVSGGGEANLLNDQASDPTTVIIFPDLIPQLQDPGDFSQGATGVQYFITVQNYGQISTTGQVVLIASLGTGITATSISGTNWGCALATLRCTRSDSLTGYGSSYETIQITVNVASNAPATSTTTAVISGGGEVNTTNDTATDITSIHGPVPDFVIASSHSGSFREGQSGATFQLTVRNTGPVASHTAVIATDAPDFSLNITNMAGTGWTCTPSSASCTRSDPLAPSAAYPPITVTVNVSSAAPLSLNNSANVYNNDELNTSNDGAIDPVTVIGVPDLSALSRHQGSFGQSQVGALFYLTAVNLGGASSTGPITLTDTLPPGLTATAMSGTGWTCTVASVSCTSVDSVGSSSFNIALTVNVAVNAPASVTNTVTVSGGGETNTTDNTSTEVIPIAPPITLTQLSGGNLIIAGQSSPFSLSVVSYTPGPIALTCTGLPALAVCNFSPASVTGQATTNLTITTTAPTLSASTFQNHNRSVPFYAFLLPLLGAFVFGYKAIPGKGSTRFAASATLTILLLLAGCGGGGSSVQQPPPTFHGGTPAGNYTITVTAADSAASLQTTTTVTLGVTWNGI